jgi:hypothetical protein
MSYKYVLGSLWDQLIRLSYIGDVILSLFNSSAELVSNPVGSSLNSQSDGVTISYYTAKDWETFQYQPDAKLCQECQTFLADWESEGIMYRERYGYPQLTYFHPVTLNTTAEKIKLSTKIGCPFCLLIFQSRVSHGLWNKDDANESEEAIKVVNVYDLWKTHKNGH